MITYSYTITYAVLEAGPGITPLTAIEVAEIESDSLSTSTTDVITTDKDIMGTAIQRISNYSNSVRRFRRALEDSANLLSTLTTTD